MHLTGYDYAADQPDPSSGLTRVATLINQARAEMPDDPVVLLDNGDSLQGTAMGDVTLQRPEGLCHPALAAFKALRYDAIGLGNHDFNYGLAAPESAHKSAPFPVICSNMKALAPALKLPFESRAILKLEGIDGQVLRIGVLSLLPPQTLSWDAAHLSDKVVIHDIVSAGRECARGLRAEGCQLVIALCHSGIADPDHKPGQENAAVPLAALDEIDVLVAGHTHLHLPGDDHADWPEVDAERGAIHGKPAVMPGANGTQLGVIDLHLQIGDGTVAILSHRSELRAVVTPESGRPPTRQCPALLHTLHPYHELTLARMHREVGHCPKPLHSYLSLIGHDAGLSLVAAAQARAVAEHLPERLRNLPLLSAVAPSKTGGRSGPYAYTDIPAGPIKEHHIYDLQVFPNTLSCVKISGQQLRDWIEASASLFERIIPGASGQMLHNPQFPGHGFDVFFGLSYQIDPTEPAGFDDMGRRIGDGNRVKSVTLDGAALESDQEVLVALSTYRAQGGGSVSALIDAELVPLPALTSRDAIRSLLEKGPMPDLSVQPWAFVPVPTTRISFLTGPGALDHLDAPELPPIQYEGQTEAGFLRLSIAL